MARIETEHECGSCRNERTDIRWWCYRVRQALARFEERYSSRQLDNIARATWSRTDDEWQRLFWESIDTDR